MLWACDFAGVDLACENFQLSVYTADATHTDVTHRFFVAQKKTNKTKHANKHTTYTHIKHAKCLKPDEWQSEAGIFVRGGGGGDGDRAYKSASMLSYDGPKFRLAAQITFVPGRACKPASMFGL